MSQLKEGVIIRVNADFPVYRTDQTRIAHRLTPFVQTADNGGVQPILRAQRRGERALYGANNHHAGVQVGMLIQQIKLPVDKCPKKVTFTELDDTFRVLRAGKITTV